MRFHSASFFVDKTHPITPKFDKLYTDADDVFLTLHSGTNSRKSPDIAIFFANHQEATNFKNAIHQSWETFLRKENPDE